MRFSEIMRQAMDEKGWSEQDLSDKTGISKATIHNYRIGGSPKREYLKDVCKALGLDPDDLPVDDPSENMSVTEAARRMQKSPEYVHACILNGTLPGCTDGRGGFHIPRRGFERYMDGINEQTILASAKAFEGILNEIFNRVKEKTQG